MEDAVTKKEQILESARKAEAQMLQRLVDSNIPAPLKQSSLKRLEELGEAQESKTLDNFISGLKDAFSDDEPDM
jgi:hypothetical protein